LNPPAGLWGGLNYFGKSCYSESKQDIGDDMAGVENYDFQNLSNVAEKIVRDELGDQLNRCTTDVCKCNDCVVDMAAMALNAVKPLYCCSLLGELYTAEAKNDVNYMKTLQEAVRLAIEKVSLNPGHG
jgi:competence protein ComFB